MAGMKANFRIFKDIEALSIAAAEIFAESVAQAIKERNRFLVVLSGGNTPSGLYRLLGSEPYRSRIDWEQTFIFWGDERCVPPQEEGSNYHQAHETLLSQLPG
jgi:6-phosphogluconolactonase